MNVADGFSCKRHYTNTVNCMLGTKTIRANPDKFAFRDGYINCPSPLKEQTLNSNRNIFAGIYIFAIQL